MNFEKLWEELEEKYPRFIKAREEADIIKEIVDEINNPPTAEEVCEALSEYYDNRKIEFWNDKPNDLMMFYFIEGIAITKYDYQKDKVIFHNNLPLHLITLIGRFYEGVKDNA